MMKTRNQVQTTSNIIRIGKNVFRVKKIAYGIKFEAVDFGLSTRVRIGEDEPMEVALKEDETVTLSEGAYQINDIITNEEYMRYLEEGVL